MECQLVIPTFKYYSFYMNYSSHYTNLAVNFYLLRRITFTYTYTE